MAEQQFSCVQFVCRKPQTFGFSCTVSVAAAVVLACFVEYSKLEKI